MLTNHTLHGNGKFITRDREREGAREKERESANMTTNINRHPGATKSKNIINLKKTVGQTLPATGGFFFQYTITIIYDSEIVREK